MFGGHITPPGKRGLTRGLWAETTARGVHGREGNAGHIEGKIPGIKLLPFCVMTYSL